MGRRRRSRPAKHNYWSAFDLRAARREQEKEHAGGRSERNKDTRGGDKPKGNLEGILRNEVTKKFRSGIEERGAEICLIRC
jgi:hypothetical protein